VARGLERVDVGASGIALIALAGEWVAHTIEYLRVGGWHGAFGSVHLMMGPMGVALLVGALVAVSATARLARLLEDRLSQLRRPARRGPAVAAPAGPTRDRSVPLLSLAAILWVTQCGLYVVQENVEAHLLHRPMPALSVLAGVHAWAPVVHLAVAASLAVGLWLSRRQVTRLVAAVRLAEARLGFGVPPAGTSWGAPAVRSWTPVDRWGMHLWSRPPPAPRVALPR
jgi:hypothetical protein